MTLAMPDSGAQVAVIPTFQDQAIARLGEWAQSAQAANRIAIKLVETSFVPQQFRGKPDEATAAILAGLEVGLSPMNALRAFDIIQGTAAPRAITLRAIVQAAGHEIQLIESTDTRCRMRGRRRGASEWQTVTWTIDRAKALGLTGKDNWKKQAGAMLVARASGEIARLIAADAILGIAYTTEEITDGVAPEEPTVAYVPESTAATRRMGRRSASAPDQPPAHEEPLPQDLLDPQGPLTEAQQRKVFALYNQAGFTDRAERLADISDFLGHDVASSSDLTVDEARRLIDMLEMRAEGGGS